MTTQAAAKEPTQMTDQQLREIIESAPLLRQMIEGAEAEALRRLESGKTIEGIKAVLVVAPVRGRSMTMSRWQRS